MVDFRAQTLNMLLFILLLILELHGCLSSNPIMFPATNTTNCSLNPVDPLFRDKFIQLMDSGVKMFDFDVKMANQPDDVLESKGGNIYKWNHWFRIVDNRGKSLLMLDENYHLLSMNSMKISVEQLSVSLADDPPGCIRSLSTEEATDVLRRTIINDFSDVPPLITMQSAREPTQSVCNMYIKDEDGYARNLYTCCHYIKGHALVCSDVEKDDWMGILLVFVIVIKILLVMYSPLLIPERMYRVKFTDAEYQYHIPDDSPDLGKKTIKVVATRNPENYVCTNEVIKLDKILGMEYFKTMLTRMSVDKIFDIKLDVLRLSVSSHRLLPENMVPVGIFRYFYNNFCRCKIRNVQGFINCCSANIFGNFGFKNVKWYRCLVPFMKVIQMCLLILPWIVRVAIYINYEQSNEEYKKMRASQLGLQIAFTGSFTILLSPLHGLFIVTYVILLLDALIYGVISQAVKERLVMVTTKCLRAMRETSKVDICTWSAEIALAPFISCGILGILLVIPYWCVLIPVLTLMFLFYFIPTINFLTRMVIHFIIFLCPDRLAIKLKILLAKNRSVNQKLKLNDLKEEGNFHNKENMTKGDLVVQFIVIIICIISFLSLTFLVMECVSFFVEVIFYTTIGIIINAKTALKYLSVLSLVILYAKDCFGKLHKKYLAFHKVICGELLAKEKDEIERVARSDALYQENTAFRVIGEGNRHPDATLIVKDQKIRWDTSGFLVFLNHEDKPFFPEKFFFRVIEMKYHWCPGPLYINIYKSFKEFMKIVIFIVFVIIVIMAFGDMYNISSTNQLIVTGAGGLLPFVFRHFFANKGDVAFDVNSVQFKAEFNRTLVAFKQTWPVFDIVPMKMKQQPSRYSTLPEIDESTEEFLEAASAVGENMTNNNSGTGVLATSSSNNSLDGDDNVDLVVDISNFSERYRAKLNDQRRDGSLSMLAETYEATDKTAMTANKQYIV